MPVGQVQASFFSALFGDQVYAFTLPPPKPSSDSQNSQTLALLQVTDTSSTIKPNTDTTIVDNALHAPTGPMGVSDGTSSKDASSNETSVYVVRPGDNVSTIAEMFNVSVNTILAANDLKKGDKITEGQILLILPVSGLEHTVTKGQTLQGIAKLYKVDINDIASYNGIALDSPLAVGDQLMIPGGDMASAESGKPVQNLSASIAKDNQYYVSHPIKNLAGYYVNPVPGYTKSQGIHDNNAVDLAIATGTPIHAAAAGIVTLARTGYNGGFGNLIVISHPNGTETLYAHQSKIATTTGATVAQGEVIGYVGSTGRSTGPHLHFEVHGARNPGADGSWAN